LFFIKKVKIKYKVLIISPKARHNGIRRFSIALIKRPFEYYLLSLKETSSVYSSMINFDPLNPGG
jgi:hypothetical protein